MSRKDTITVEVAGKRHPATKPFEEADHCRIDIACPHCKTPAPIGVAGSGRSVDPDASHDTWIAEGYTTCCKHHLGKIRVKVHDTLFGVKEDENVYATCAQLGIRIY
jgi:hypothetical protein